MVRPQDRFRSFCNVMPLQMKLISNKTYQYIKWHDDKYAFYLNMYSKNSTSSSTYCADLM